MAGYTGGGAFVEERFFARFKRAKLLEFVWFNFDHISGEERSDIHFCSDEEFWPDEEVAKCCDAHADVFLQWHDNEEWENGHLCLAPGLEHTEGILWTPGDEPRPPRGRNWQLSAGNLFLPPTFHGKNHPRAMEKIKAMVPYTGIMTRWDQDT